MLLIVKSLNYLSLLKEWDFNAHSTRINFLKPFLRFIRVVCESFDHTIQCLLNFIKRHSLSNLQIYKKKFSK